MTAVIQTEKLTKSYGSHRGIIDVDLAVQQGEVFGFLGPERRRQDDDDPDVLLDLIRPTSGQALVFGIESHAPTRSPSTAASATCPGEFTLYDRLTGGQTLDYFANLRGGVDRGLPGRRSSSASTSTRRAASRSTPRATSRRSAWSSRSSTSPSCSSSTSRPSGLDPLVQQTFFAIAPRGGGRRPRRSSSRATSCPRSRRRCDRVAIIREGRLVKVDTRRRPARPRPPPGRAALRRARSRPPTFEQLAGRQRRRRRGPRPADARGRRRSPRSSRPRPGTSCSTSCQPRAEPRGDVPGPVRPRAPSR